MRETGAIAYVAVLVLLGATLFAPGCNNRKLTNSMTDSDSPSGTWTRSDWIANVDRNLLEGQWETVEKNRVVEPKAERNDEGITALKTGSYLELSAEEFDRYSGLSYDFKGNEKPYLVRAVMLESTRGGFEVQTLDGYVRVHYNCLGKRRTNEKNHPLIVILPKPPKRVFVTCHMVS